MRILITGAAGFIGSHLSERLISRGDHVTGFDNFDEFYPRAIKERNLTKLRLSPSFRLVEGDLANPSNIATALDTANGIDTVIHLAALAGVRPSILNPQHYWTVNVTGTLHLLTACHERGIKRLVFGSSSSVYGKNSSAPFRESDPCNNPLSPYAATKRASELIAFTDHHLNGSSVTCLRFFTVYGPRQRPDLAIHKFTQSIANGQHIEIFGDGTSSRDYTWIDDILDGTLASIEQQTKEAYPSFHVYNLGGARTTSLKNLISLIASSLGKAAHIDWKPEQPGDMSHTLANIDLAQSDLNYSPKVDIQQGIPRFVKWWLTENGH